MLPVVPCDKVTETAEADTDVTYVPADIFGPTAYIPGAIPNVDDR